MVVDPLCVKQVHGFESATSSTTWEAAEQAMELHTADHLDASGQASRRIAGVRMVPLPSILLWKARYGVLAVS